MSRFLVLLLLAAACRSAAPSGAVLQRAGASRALTELVDEYIEAQNRFDPTSAVARGFHAYDDKLPDRSRARIEAYIAEMKTFVARFEALDAGKLSADEAVDLQALLSDARASVHDLEKVRMWEKNPMGIAGLAGDAIDVLMKRDFAPARDRLRSAIARLRALPAAYAAMRPNISTTPPREYTEAAIENARGSLGFLEGSFPVWAQQAAGPDAALLAEANAANAVALAATREILDWLERDVKPRSTGSYALGAELFLEKLRLDDMVDLPLDQLLARGEAQLAKDRAAFVEVARRIDPNLSPEEVARRMTSDHPTAETLVPAVRDSVEAARKYAVEKQLVTIPSEVRPRVEETPAFERAGGLASMDAPGPFETKASEAFYYVTPVEKDWDAKKADEYLRGFAYPVMAMVNVHEAFPGHFVQFVWVPRLTSKTRKVVFASSNSEGWAHYTEQMMVDEGFGGGDPRVRLAQLMEALLRDCRYVVGIKEHTQGMTVAEGARLFTEQCAQPGPIAYLEARRGTFNPTYLYYTLGKLMIQDLRDDYMKAKKASLREFHDAFLAHGALPIPLVRKLLLP